ncbi:hypothetical protein QYE76_024611 [Lolium multiflorum]|uniref:Retrotransposon Copia-like N-terminal domain-containing protein n=1 Tax=Lolium multiflorum TaxID=4521 RepID=A0AAD8RGH2_LOLMU|nr:hypothetical protein QYE76_024611 [Lolium multiflorum]
MASSSSTAPTTLGNPPSDKLTRANFPGWRAQVLPAIRGARLLGYLTGTSAAPPKEIEVTADKDSADKAPKLEPNPAYDTWIAQDQIVLSYLLQSLSHEVLPHVHRIEHAAGVWKALEEMFASQSEAKITNLRTSLANTKKLNMPTLTYLTKMQGFVNELAMAGCPVSTREHTSRLLPMPRNANVVAAQIKSKIAVIVVTVVTTVTLGALIVVMIVLPPMAVVVVAHRLVAGRAVGPSHDSVGGCHLPDLQPRGTQGQGLLVSLAR